MDMYLCGYKGLKGLQAAIDNNLSISRVILGQDSGVLDDPYELIRDLASSRSIQVLGSKDTFQQNSIALALGWKKLIKLPYSNLFVIHDSLLPKYKGWNPLVTSLQAGASILGATLICANDKMDSGTILSQRSFSVDYPQTISEAMEKIGFLIPLLIQDLVLFLKGELKEYVPNFQLQESYSLWRDEQDYILDWSKSSGELVRFVDSVSFPYKGAIIAFDSKIIRVTKVEERPEIEIANRMPGKIFQIEDGLPIVICGKGLLKIVSWQYDGDSNNVVTVNSIRTRF